MNGFLTCVTLTLLLASIYKNIITIIPFHSTYTSIIAALFFGVQVNE